MLPLLTAGSFLSAPKFFSITWRISCATRMQLHAPWRARALRRRRPRSRSTPIRESAMQRYCGLHLVAFAVPDAAAAHRRLASGGFRVRPLVHMARPVATLSGMGRAAFTVTRVEPGEMAEGRIQILTHHTEEMVWQPRWLTHPNGALALQRVVIAVEDVHDAVERHARFTGRQPRALPSGCRIELDRGRIDLVSRAGFEHMLPEIAIPSLPFIGACEIRVASLPKLKESLDRARLRIAAHPDGVLALFPEELGLGAWLFRE